MEIFNGGPIISDRADYEQKHNIPYPAGINGQMSFQKFFDSTHKSLRPYLTELRKSQEWWNITGSTLLTDPWGGRDSLIGEHAKIFRPNFPFPSANLWDVYPQETSNPANPSNFYTGTFLSRADSAKNIWETSDEKYIRSLMDQYYAGDEGKIQYLTERGYNNQQAQEILNNPLRWNQIFNATTLNRSYISPITGTPYKNVLSTQALADLEPRIHNGNNSLGTYTQTLTSGPNGAVIQSTSNSRPTTTQTGVNPGSKAQRANIVPLQGVFSPQGANLPLSYENNNTLSNNPSSYTPVIGPEDWSLGRGPSVPWDDVLMGFDSGTGGPDDNDGSQGPDSGSSGARIRRPGFPKLREMLKTPSSSSTSTQSSRNSSRRPSLRGERALSTPNIADLLAQRDLEMRGRQMVLNPDTGSSRASHSTVRTQPTISPVERQRIQMELSLLESVSDRSTPEEIQSVLDSIQRSGEDQIRFIEMAQTADIAGVRQYLGMSPLQASPISRLPFSDLGNPALQTTPGGGGVYRTPAASQNLPDQQGTDISHQSPLDLLNPLPQPSIDENSGQNTGNPEQTAEIETLMNDNNTRLDVSLPPTPLPFRLRAQAQGDGERDATRALGTNAQQTTDLMPETFTDPQDTYNVQLDYIRNVNLENLTDEELTKIDNATILLRRSLARGSPGMEESWRLDSATSRYRVLSDKNKARRDIEDARAALLAASENIQPRRSSLSNRRSSSSFSNVSNRSSRSTRYEHNVPGEGPHSESTREVFVNSRDARNNSVQVLCREIQDRINIARGTSGGEHSPEQVYLAKARLPGDYMLLQKFHKASTITPVDFQDATKDALNQLLSPSQGWESLMTDRTDLTGEKRAEALLKYYDDIEEDERMTAWHEAYIKPFAKRFTFLDRVQGGPYTIKANILQRRSDQMHQERTGSLPAPSITQNPIVAQGGTSGSVPAPPVNVPGIPAQYSVDPALVRRAQQAGRYESTEILNQNPTIQPTLTAGNPNPQQVMQSEVQHLSQVGESTTNPFNHGFPSLRSNFVNNEFPTSNVRTGYANITDQEARLNQQQLQLLRTQDAQSGAMNQNAFDGTLGRTGAWDQATQPFQNPAGHQIPDSFADFQRRGNTESVRFKKPRTANNSLYRK